MRPIPKPCSTSAGAGVTSLGAATSVTAVGEHTRLTLAGGVATWRDDVALRSMVASSEAAGTSDAAATSSLSSAADPYRVAVEEEGEVVPVDGPPGAPTDVTLGLDGDRLSIGWTVPDDGGSRITRYRIEAHDAATGELVASRNELASRRATVLAGIRGRDVDVRVAATNVHGTGAWSELQRFAMRAPGAPTVVGIEQGTGGRIAVRMEPAADGAPAPTRVEVRIMDSDAPRARALRGTTCIGARMRTCTLLLATNRTPTDGRVWIEVRGHSALGWGAYGDRVGVTLDTPRPTAATRVTAAAMSGGRLDVRWSRAPLAEREPHQRQVVEVRQGSGPDAPLVTTCTVGGTQSRCVVSGLPRGVDLSVTIRADNRFGEGERSAPVSLRLR